MPLQTGARQSFCDHWSGYVPPRAKLAGTRAFKSYKLAELVPYID